MKRAENEGGVSGATGGRRDPLPPTFNEMATSGLLSDDENLSRAVCATLLTHQSATMARVGAVAEA